MANPFGDVEINTNPFGDEEVGQDLTGDSLLDDSFGIEPEPEPELKPKSGISDAWTTTKNILQVTPALDAAASFVTTGYGLPLSGLGGLMTLVATGGDLKSANDAVEKIQKTLIHKPMTPGGEQLGAAASYPFTKFEEAGKAAGAHFAKAGSPNVAAAVDTAIAGIPFVALGTAGLVKFRASNPKYISQKFSDTVKSGIGKAIKPTKRVKQHSQITDYYNKAESVVLDIINNKDKFELVDKNGQVRKGTPTTVDEFSQAIQQLKRGVFEEMDGLIKTVDDKSLIRPLEYPLKPGEKIVFEGGKPIGIKGLASESGVINLNEVASSLSEITSQEALKRFSPETIKYAEGRAAFMKERGGRISAADAQDAIQIFNQSLEAYYADPTPATKGRALVDSFIANKLREQMDAVVESKTGVGFQSIKDRYGALKAVEKDIAKQAFNLTKRNRKGLTDIADTFSAHQVVRGLMAKDPAVVAGGAASKFITSTYKALNNPNRQVKSMFEKAESLVSKQAQATVPKAVKDMPVYMNEDGTPAASPFKPSLDTKEDLSPNQLNMMVPVNQIPKTVKDVLDLPYWKKLESIGQLYRNKELWRNTGFWLGKDGKWRFEIGSDKARLSTKRLAMINKINKGDLLPVQRVFESPKLYQAIPELKKIDIKVDPNLRVLGEYNVREKTIVLKSAKDEQTFYHEFQHAINDFMDISSGTNQLFEAAKGVAEEVIRRLKKIAYETENPMTASGLDTEIKVIEGAISRDAVPGNLQKWYWDELLPFLERTESKSIVNQVRSPFYVDSAKRYKTNLGEMEARLVEDRMSMSPKERANEAPWVTLDRMLRQEGFNDPATGSTLYSGLPVDKMIGNVETVIKRPVLEKLKAAGWKWKQAGLNQQPGYTNANEMWRMIEPSPGIRRPMILIPPEKPKVPNAIKNIREALSNMGGVEPTDASFENPLIPRKEYIKDVPKITPKASTKLGYAAISENLSNHYMPSKSEMLEIAKESIFIQAVDPVNEVMARRKEFGSMNKDFLDKFEKSIRKAKMMAIREAESAKGKDIKVGKYTLSSEEYLYALKEVQNKEIESWHQKFLDHALTPKQEQAFLELKKRGEL